MPRPDFRAHVYAVVQRIPAGQVLTYGEVAARAGNPRAARAVGALMRSNHKSFLTHPNDPDAIPCHRVVAAGHRLGGYNGGIEVKRRLLESENWQVYADRLQKPKEQV
ncbi:MGMT family protein [Candidatus Berkelbacteria bacterium]|nr:MGMT family protein [Candidatus Berkelbacteria bacterium]